MPRSAVLFCVLLGVSAVAQQTVSPRRQASAPLITFDPEPSDRHDGRFTRSADRLDRWNERAFCHDRAIAGDLHQRGSHSGCEDGSWPKPFVYLPGR